MTMDDETLTDRVCDFLATLPTFDYRADAPAGGVQVFYGSTDDEPDRAIGVRVYGAADPRHLHWRRMQIRSRGKRHDKQDADRIAAVVFAVLHGLSQLGGISGISRESMSPLGADQSGREERTDNYIITLDNQEALQ